MKPLIIVIVLLALLFVIILLSSIFGRKSSDVCIITNRVCNKDVGSCKDCNEYKSSKYYKEVNNNGSRKN